MAQKDPRSSAKVPPVPKLAATEKAWCNVGRDACKLVVQVLPSSRNADVNTVQ